MQQTAYSISLLYKWMNRPKNILIDAYRGEH